MLHSLIYSLRWYDFHRRKNRIRKKQAFLYSQNDMDIESAGELTCKCVPKAFS